MYIWAIQKSEVKINIIPKKSFKYGIIGFVSANFNYRLNN